MEAVRQISFPERRVELRGGSLVIDRLVVEDRTVVDLVERRLERDIDPADTVSDALEIGARVLDREATGAEVDFVRKEFERASTEVETAFAEKARGVAEDLQRRLEQFLGEEGGAMGKALDRHAEELGELIARTFGVDRSTAVQHQIRELTGKMLGESRQELLRQFSAQDGHNPLADFKGSVVREMRAYREKHESLLEKLAGLEVEIQRLHDARTSEAELAAAHELGTQKGRDFEQRVFDVLDGMAASRADVAHHVGDMPSASGGKRGDIVVEVDAASGPPRARIAFDAKDEKLSKNRAWEILNDSLEERDAAFAVLVVASDDKLPAGREPLQEYEGNKMIVTLDRDTLDARALELAYRYARCRALMAVECTLEVDAAGVRDASEEALSALRDAQKIRRSLTGATNSVDSARQALDVMVQRVEAALERVESLIGSGPG